MAKAERPAKDLKVDLPDGERSSPSGGNQITLERFNTPTRNVLRKFDDNGDGRIDANEIQAVVSTLVAEKFKSKAFKIGLIVLGVFTIILLGAMFGLTWAVVAALKDTEVNDSGVMTTSDGASTPVLTANLDMTVSSDGKLVSRTSNSTIATTPAVTRSAISSEVSFDLLLKLRNLVFVSPGGGLYSVDVQGVARIPKTTGGHVVRFQTASGILVLERNNWELVNATNAMLDGLFSSGTSGRRLLDDGVKYYLEAAGGTPIKCPDPDNFIDECPSDDVVYKWVNSDYTTPLEPGQSAPPPPSPPTGEQSVGGADCSGGQSSGPVSSCAEAMSRCTANTADKINALLDKQFCGTSCGSLNQDEVAFGGYNGITVSRTTQCQKKASSTKSFEFCCP
ncbi:hypothetical protein HXX76_014389 [Chlamydomonas incerta]|uniref:EF-hand domain-containing protein n=1 Tax=Chlamydomonas incerta TaxID=51695 RepID=A0A835SC19_CHLIN|nr:hypothetical protein HXX76_014389 [Chlamydomonas incerta]|eukprot:KAG2424508.1 hypothetical protein HXX76_014389 [Chlamydomonas incerta]